MKFELSDRDFGLFALEDFDIEAQLIAVQDLLRRNSEADERVRQRINEYADKMQAATGDQERHLDDLYVDECHRSVFQDAAHSLAAAGMLAPLIESYFTAAFPTVARQLDLSPSATSEDVRSAHSVAQYWDPHFVFNKNGTRKDLVEGIAQLSKSIGLDAEFPADFREVLKALFLYRNKVFHHGFEWPMDERKRFLQTSADENWPSEWFTFSKRNEDPWIIYMTTEFVEKCLSTFDLCLTGVGRFIRKKLA